MFNARADADRLAALLAREHACMADFLEALAAFDRRRGWEVLGYSSLFWFLHRELKLSKGAAHYRASAVALVNRHPEVLSCLRDGRLCLMAVVELAKVLTKENEHEVLPRFFHLSRREAAELAASIRPVERPATRTVVAAPAPALLPATSTPYRCDMNVAVQPVERNARDESPRPEVVPLDAELRRLHITVSKRLLAKIELARDALSHSQPMASMEAVLEVGLDLVIERHRKRRGVGVAAVGRSSRSAAPDRMTADMKRTVWERDSGRCQWPLDGGGICGSTTRLEYDHVVPRGLGGSSEAANLRLLCRFHNQRAARQVYGDDLVDRFAPRAPRASEPVPDRECTAA